MDRLEETLGNEYWRLNNLYHIVNKDGKDVIFKMNKAQEDFYKNRSKRNIILKARQLGFSTLIQIMMLDKALFNSNMRCDVITYDKKISSTIFNSKIKYAYERLPIEIKEIRKVVRSNSEMLQFNNNSSIYVSTSSRGGTVNMLHVSEYGKMCAKYVEKAREVKSGSMQAVPKDGEIFVESTAEGCNGDFYDMYMEYRDREIKDEGSDYKTFFYPWYLDKEEYSSNIEYEPRKEEKRYEEKVKRLGIEISRDQWNWYWRKKPEVKGDIQQEYPTYDEEAFALSGEGKIWSDVIRIIEDDGQISVLPYIAELPVYVAMDLGYNDITALWFYQIKGEQVRFINYYENNRQPPEHYFEKMRSLGYAYGCIFLPHDAKQSNFANGGVSAYERMSEWGIPIQVIPRMSSKNDMIYIARAALRNCYFDEDKCKEGLIRLNNYHKKKDKNGNWGEPVHDSNSNGADAFQYACITLDFLKDISYSNTYENDERYESQRENIYNINKYGGY